MAHLTVIQMNRKTDITIFKRIKKGDESAFEELFRKYFTGLCIYAREFVKKNEVAEEIVEDVFCKIWEKRKSLEVTVSLKSYLYRSVYNTSLNYLKSEKHHMKNQDNLADNFENMLPISTPGDITSSSLLSEELEMKIEQAINSLPEKSQIIFRLSRFEGLKYSEIAEKLNLSVKTVETQISRVLKKLRVQLKDYL